MQKLVHRTVLTSTYNPLAYRIPPPAVRRWIWLVHYFYNTLPSCRGALTSLYLLLPFIRGWRMDSMLCFEVRGKRPCRLIVLHQGLSALIAYSLAFHLGGEILPHPAPLIDVSLKSKEGLVSTYSCIYPVLNMFYIYNVSCNTNVNLILCVTFSTNILNT